MKKHLHITLALVCALSASLPQTVVAASAPTALSVSLPSNPKLKKAINLNLPTGASLSTVLSAITKTAGLTLLSRDLPSINVPLTFKGVTAKTALEQLLNLYQDQIKAVLIGDTLFVAPPGVINQITGSVQTIREIIQRTLTDADIKTVSTISGAAVLPFGNSVIVSGTPSQVKDARALIAQLPEPAASDKSKGTGALLSQTVEVGTLDPAVISTTLTGLYDVQVNVAYGRAYLQSISASDLAKAGQTLQQMVKDQQGQAPKPEASTTAQSGTTTTPTATPAPTARMTLTTLLAQEVVARIVQSVNPAVKLTPLESGSYLISGQQGDLNDINAMIQEALKRDALRVTVTYPGTAQLLEQARSMFPTLAIRTVGDDLEVRANPAEQVNVSRYLNGSAKLNDPQVQMTVQLAFTTPSAVAAQLTKLYPEAGGTTGQANSTDTAVGTVTPAPQLTIAPAPGSAPTPAAPVATAPASASVTSAPSKSSEPVLIVPDDRSRTLLLRGPESLLVKMRQSVTDLDRAMRDVRFALKVQQISATDGQDLGLNWQIGAGGLAVGVNSGTVTAQFQPGLSPLTFQASLDLARSQGRLNTLLDTTFSTQDGQPVAFKNGGRILLPTTTSTSSGGTTSTSTGRETYNYGLDLLITPRLAPDGRIELNVRVQLGQPPRAGVQNSVVIEEQTLSTITTLKPGESIVLGSVLSQTETADKKGIPVLSEIPVIGGLFGKTSTSKSNSLILITLQAADRSSTDAPVVPNLQGGSVTRVTTPASKP